MAGWGFFHGHNSFAVSLLIGFYTMLRSGELLGLLSSHILCAPSDRQVLISLGLTKSGKRQGAAESVILGIEAGVRLTQHWKKAGQIQQPDGIFAIEVASSFFRKSEVSRTHAV